jgi:hypothetical protein
MEKAFNDARRDWDCGLQVQLPTLLLVRVVCASSLILQTTLSEAMTRDSIGGAIREGSR